jgi:hypothetical protein
MPVVVNLMVLYESLVCSFLNNHFHTVFSYDFRVNVETKHNSTKLYGKCALYIYRMYRKIMSIAQLRALGITLSREVVMNMGPLCSSSSSSTLLAFPAERATTDVGGCSSANQARDVAAAKWRIS